MQFKWKQVPCKCCTTKSQLVLWTAFRWCGDKDQSSASSCSNRKLTSYLFSPWHESLYGNHFISVGALVYDNVLLCTCFAKAMSNTVTLNEMAKTGCVIQLSVRCSFGAVFSSAGASAYVKVEGIMSSSCWFWHKIFRLLWERWRGHSPFSRKTTQSIQPKPTYIYIDSVYSYL